MQSGRRQVAAEDADTCVILANLSWLQDIRPAGRGTHMWTLDREKSRLIIKPALDLGINFYDTANILIGRHQ